MQAKSIGTNPEKPEFLDHLINLASKAAGSDYKLAQQLGVTRQNVSNWRHAKTSCPVADIALMADIAGLNAEAWTNRAVVSQYAGTNKGELLARVLGKSLLATGAVFAGSGSSAARLIDASFDHFIRCILWIPRSRLSVQSHNVS
jgi:transcriptional regulator with XRE-family HTH domain